MNLLSRLKAGFNNDLHETLEREGVAHLTSTHFRQMIDQYGGVETAHRLLKPDCELPPDTFGSLRRIGRLDLTAEFYVVMEKYRPLFSDQEREIARWRLDNEDSFGRQGKIRSTTTTEPPG
jgi:hypothetical protein